MNELLSTLLEQYLKISLHEVYYQKVYEILSDELKFELESQSHDFLSEYEKEWILNEISMYLTGEDYLFKTDKGVVYWTSWNKSLLNNYEKFLEGKFSLKPYLVNLKFKELDKNSRKVPKAELQQEITILAENKKNLIDRLDLIDWEGLVFENYKIKGMKNEKVS